MGATGVTPIPTRAAIDTISGFITTSNINICASNAVDAGHLVATTWHI
jgi:hypothetical protein